MAASHRRAATVVRAAAVAGALSGIPSTAHAVATGRDPLEAVRAAGTLLAGEAASARRLVVAAVAAHGLLSLLWSAVLVPPLVRRPDRAVLLGAAGGVAIAALDLSIARRRFPRVAALPQAAQVADHALFGVLVGVVVAAEVRRGAAGGDEQGGRSGDGVTARSRRHRRAARSA